MISFNSWIIVAASVVLGVSLSPGSSAESRQQVITLPPTDGPSYPSDILPPWWSPPFFSYSSQPINPVPDRPAAIKGGIEGHRNGTIWIFRGDSYEHLNCNFTAALPPPKKIELPPDICLYGTANNFTFLMNETAVCGDGNEAWLALYRGSACQNLIHMINPEFVLASNICLNTGIVPNSTHVIFKLSMMFHCVDTVDGSMPKKLMDSELDLPVIEDPPETRLLNPHYDKDTFSLE